MDGHLTRTAIHFQDNTKLERCQMSETVETKQAVILSPKQAANTLRRYCCAGCWGPLTEYIVPGGLSRVACGRCGDGRGFVTRRYAENRLACSVAEALEVKLLLREANILPKRSAGQILAEMGF